MARQNRNDAEGSQRISLPLDAEGGIDWENVRGSARKAFLNAVENDVTTLEHIGMAHTGTAVDPAADGEGLDLEITQQDVHNALDEIFAAESAIFRVFAAKFIKHPLMRDRDGKPVPMIIEPDIADRSFKLTEKDHKALDARVTRQVKRIPVPEWMKKNLDLWMIGIYLGKATLTNVQTAMKDQIKRDLQRAMEHQAQQAAKHNPRPDTDARPQQQAPPATVTVPAEEGESLNSEAAIADAPPPSGLPNISEQPLV